MQISASVSNAQDTHTATVASRITIREAGEWMLLATSGTSWGCTVVSIN